jgi:hypothetical protein
MSKEPLTEEQIVEGVRKLLDISKKSRKDGYLSEGTVLYRFNEENPKCSQNQINDALEFLFDAGEVVKRKFGGERDRYRSV